MKRLILLFALFAPGFITLAQVGPESVNRTGRGRYIAAQDFEVKNNQMFSQPVYNGNPAMLDGYGKATARELGLSGREVWNEYPQGAVKVTLSPNAELYYDSASKEPLYLGGCLRKGKPWVNRIKLVTPQQVQAAQPPVAQEIVREPVVNVTNQHPITNNHPITVNVPPEAIRVQVTVKEDLSWWERGLRAGYWGSGIYYHVRMPQEVSLLRKEIRGFRHDTVQALDRVRIPGPKGDKGDPGELGAACDPEKNPLCRGPQGERGDKGDQADPGLAGPQGPKGDPGASGSQGPQGPKGDPGSTGSQGLKGDPGVPGAPCDPLKNPLCRGPQGLQGPPGQTVYVPQPYPVYQPCTTQPGKPCFVTPPNPTRP